MTSVFPDLLSLAKVVKPETIVRWHRAGFKTFWRWKSRRRAGRPKVDCGLRDLIRRMCEENPLWGAPRIHGELQMLGFDVAQSTVSKYMLRRRSPPSQSWKTFLRNHAHAIAAIDMCVVPMLTFERLFAFLVLGHGRRHLLWFEVTRHPTAEWLARQITEAFPWTSAPIYLIRDNDGAYGHVFTRRLRAMGIRDQPISPGSPWQNGHAERLIGTVRRECLDHVLIVGAGHSVGSVVPVKGYDLLIAALATLTDMRWRLTIAGDRTRNLAAVAQLDADIETHGLRDRVAMPGAVPPERIVELFLASDIFALASRFEGYGMALTEAIAHGIPIVSTTAGAIPQTVPAGTGLLVPPDDAAALAQALRRLIVDPAARRRFATNARAAAARLPTWQESARLFVGAVEMVRL